MLYGGLKRIPTVTLGGSAKFWSIFTGRVSRAAQWNECRE